MSIVPSTTTYCTGQEFKFTPSVKLTSVVPTTRTVNTFYKAVVNTSRKRCGLLLPKPREYNVKKTCEQAHIVSV